MSRISFSMMEAGVIPGDLGAFKKECGKIKLYGGESAPSSAPTQQTTNSVSYSKEAQPFVNEAMQRAATLTSMPYQTYGGMRQAAFDPLQAQAQQSVANMTVAPQLGLATQLAGNAGRDLGQIQYDPSNITAQRTRSANQQMYEMGGPQAIYTSSFTEPGSMEQYMSPYYQGVVDVQQREAERQADIANTQRNAQAVQAGAFGGSRQGIQNAEAERNLAQQKGDIQAKGLQAAYEQAQGLYGTEASRALQAAQANQQAGLQAGGQNLNALLGVQQGATSQGLQAQLANQQTNLTAQQQNEASRQFGANLGLQALQSQIQSANALSGIGQQQSAQEQAIVNAQNAAGAQRQAAEQQKMATAYQDFLSQQQYPYQQNSYMMEMLKGTPQQTTQSIYQAPPNMASQAAGLGLAAYGLFKAEGGVIDENERPSDDRPAGLSELALYNIMSKQD